MEFHTNGINKCIETRLGKEPGHTSSFMTRRVFKMIQWSLDATALWKDE